MGERVNGITDWRRLGFWQALLLYGLLICSSFAVAGMEFFTMLLMAVAIAVWLRRRPPLVLPYWLLAPFVLIVLWALIVMVLNPQPWRTLAHMAPEYRVFAPFAILPALYQVRPGRALATYGIGMALFALYGVVQYEFGVDWFRSGADKLIRPFAGTGSFHAMGYFTHHLTFAGVMLMQAPLFFALGISERHRRRWLWFAIGAATWVGLLVSLGRSAWLGSLVGLGVLIFMLPRRWCLALLSLGLAGVIALAMLLSHDALQSGERIPGVPGIINRALQTSIGQDKDRLYLWEAAWLGIQEHPWIGVGLGNERYTYEAYRQVVSARHDDYQFTNRASAGIHNIYLHFAFTLGWPGLALYLALHGAVAWWCIAWIRAARGAFPLEQGLLWGSLGGLAGLAVASMFQNYFFDAEVQNAIVITIALALYAGQRVQHGLADGGGMGSARG